MKFCAVMANLSVGHRPHAMTVRWCTPTRFPRHSLDAARWRHFYLLQGANEDVNQTPSPERCCRALRSFIHLRRLWLDDAHVTQRFHGFIGSNWKRGLLTACIYPVIAHILLPDKLRHFVGFIRRPATKADRIILPSWPIPEFILTSPSMERMLGGL